MARIILVEPDRLLAETYGQALSSSGHDVVICAGAQAAITAADQGRPDLVILELQLVEHSGIEFLYEFRSYPEWQDVPVIIHSAVPPGEFSDSRQLLQDELGVSKYLYKSRTSLAQLVSSIHDQISVAA